MKYNDTILKQIIHKSLSDMLLNETIPLINKIRNKNNNTYFPITHLEIPVNMDKYIHNFMIIMSVEKEQEKKVRKLVLSYYKKVIPKMIETYISNSKVVYNVIDDKLIINL